MKNLLAELSRRNVFRVAASYVIVGWIIMQVASIIAPAMNLPGWSVSLVLYILIIGFPLALLFTWAFELTPEGVKRSDWENQPDAAKLKASDFGLIAAALLLALITLFMPPLGLVGQEEEPFAEGVPAAEALGQRPSFSLAVLPFENFSDDKQLGWIADGISEDVLTQLAAFPRLQLAARNSSFQFKGTSTDLREVGETLSVRYVLEGSLRVQADALRVTAQLVETETGAHIWAGQYNPALSEVANLHDKVIDIIVTEVASQVISTEYDRVSRISETDMSAADLVHLANRAGAMGHYKEVTRLSRLAIDRSPDNYRAHALYGIGLGMTLPLDENRERREAIKAEIRKAVKTVLDVPPQTFSYMSASVLSGLIGEQDPTLFYAKTAAEFSPDYPGVYTTLVRAQINLGDYEAALASADTCIRKVNRANPLTATCHGKRASALLGLGRFDEALEAAEISHRMADLPDVRPFILVALVKLGQVEEAGERLQGFSPNDSFLNLEETAYHYRLTLEDEAFVNMQLNALGLAGLD